ncbi:hypothetical protein BGW80DRAFT_1171423 [Lactifluus volemus]|nr:hypothetical protein BGW80DRAFT_1171423 [Lactifluus volemus]
MSAHFNPYVQGWRVGNAPSANNGETPSIFGALPGGSANRGRESPTPPNTVVFHVTDLRPNMLNATVIDARGRPCYKIITDAAQPHRTTYYDAHRRTVALVDWSRAGGHPHPSVEMPGLLPRQQIRAWLRASPDRASRMMDVRGIPYVWVPDGDYISLYFAQRSGSHRLGRICANRQGIKIELSQQAMEAHLLEVTIICASVFLSGASID